MIINGLKAIAHEGRLRLLRDIISAGQTGVTAGQLAQTNNLNFTTASAQLVTLSSAGLVTSERTGRQVTYRPNDMQISQLIAYLMRDVCQGRAEIIWLLSELTGGSFQS